MIMTIRPTVAQLTSALAYARDIHDINRDIGAACVWVLSAPLDGLRGDIIYPTADLLTSRVNAGARRYREAYMATGERARDAEMPAYVVRSLSRRTVLAVVWGDGRLELARDIGSILGQYARPSTVRAILAALDAAPRTYAAWRE